jgi:mono/diheme cytochrome c family protein
LSRRDAAPSLCGRLRFAGAFAGGLLWLAVFAACRQDMYDQPKYEPFEASRVFPDGAAARRPPNGTVTRGDPRVDSAFWSGVDQAGGFVTEPRVSAGRGLVLRGRERFEVFCAPCHGFSGDGNGMIVQRGFKRPPSFHGDALRARPVGYFVDVITHGFGVMPAYADRVPPGDRWAIAAYVQALQLSQSASLAELPPEDAARVAGSPTGPAPFEEAP